MKILLEQNIGHIDQKMEFSINCQVGKPDENQSKLLSQKLPYLELANDGTEPLCYSVFMMAAFQFQKSPN